MRVRGHGPRDPDGRADQAAGGPLLAEETRRSARTYADGLADIDLDALLALPRGHGALATMTVVRPELQFGVTELDGEDGRVHGLSREAALGALDQRRLLLPASGACSTTSQQDSVLEREPLAAPGRRRRAARLPPRGLLGVHGHLQGRGRAERPVGRGAGRVAGVGVRRVRRRRPEDVRRAPVVTRSAVARMCRRLRCRAGVGPGERVRRCAGPQGAPRRSGARRSR